MLRLLAVALVVPAALLAASPSLAAGRMCTGADTLLFGNRTVGTTTVQHAVVSNCGDASWRFTGVSVHASTGPGWRVQTTCTTGLALDPGASCSIDVTFAPAIAGQTSGALWLHNSTSTPDQLVTFYGRGVDARAGSAAVDFAPAVADFGVQAVGRASPLLVVEVRNVGTATLVPSALVINGPAAYDFTALGSGDPADCAVGAAVAPGGSCRMNLYFQPAGRGARNASLVIDAPQLPGLAMLALTGIGSVEPVVPAVPTVQVVEFAHAPTQQYFLTADADEEAFLDRGGLGPAWLRTGASFTAWPRDADVAGSQPVCRFFGTPGVGPGEHFYTADPAECALVRQDPHWQYEGIAFRAAPPADGACAAGSLAVLRLWHPGATDTESRHRYLADPAQVAPLVTAGWTLEGPVFCAPPR